MLGRECCLGMTMKYFVLVVALIIAVVVAAMYVPVKDGRTLLDPDQVSAVMAGDGEGAGQTATAEDDLPAPGTLYRWKDKHGNWQ